MLECLRQNMNLRTSLKLKRLWEINKSNENHPTYLVAISIIKVQCEKDIKSQKFFKKVI